MVTIMMFLNVIKLKLVAVHEKIVPNMGNPSSKTFRQVYRKNSELDVIRVAGSLFSMAH